MRNRVSGVFVVLTLTLSASIWSACSKQSQPSGKDVSKAQPQYYSYSSKGVIKTSAKPSDDDIVKAIDDSGVMKRADGSLEVVPPVTIVQKGKQDKNGAWPVKVKFTLKYRMKDGKFTPPTETTTSFKIFESKDSAGKPVWRAQLGS